MVKKIYENSITGCAEGLIKSVGLTSRAALIEFHHLNLKFGNYRNIGAMSHILFMINIIYI